MRRMGRMGNVYGVKVPKNAESDGKMFMNMWFSWMGCGCLAHLVGFILALIVSQKMKDIANNMTGLPSKSKKAVDTINHLHFGSMWFAEIIQALSFLMIGAGVILCARQMLKDQNLTPCCIIQGIFSALNCCAGCTWCFYLGVAISITSLLSDPTAICKHANTTHTWGNQVNTQLTNWGLPMGNITTTTLLPGNVTTTIYPGNSFDLNKCMSVLNVIKDIMTILCLYCFFVAATSCCLSLICGTGAKYARDTQDEFDDVESDDLE